MDPKRIVDLRSDTVTRPSTPMREAMARADVGDDVLGDDPSIIRLQERVAGMFGKDAALFVPSGTMANQVSIRTHTQPGDEIICHRLSHIYQYEGGAPAMFSGCSFALLEGDRGMFTPEAMRSAIRHDDPHFPRSSLVVIENTQNRGGGAIWPMDLLASIAVAARERGLKIHLDGARLMNACVASGHSPADYAKHADSISICFSKGLGAPVGSAIVGDADFIARARRARKVFGGGMRQAGILAAAAEYALDHNVERLADDHANARRFAEGIATCTPITVEQVETNIVYFDVAPSLGDAMSFAKRLHDAGVLLFDVGPRRLRAVTHLDVSGDDIDVAIKTIQSLAS